MSWAMVGGAGIGAVGGMMGTEGASESVPFRSSGVMGDISFNERSGTLAMGRSDEQARYANAFNQQFNVAARGGNMYEQGAARRAQQQGAGSIVPSFRGAQRGQFNRGALERANRVSGQGMRQQGRLGNQMERQAGQQSRMGRRLMRGAEDVNQMAQDRLGLMREMARPEEELQGNALTQRLFSMGQMGTEGGARNIGAFGTALAQADLSRQMGAMDFAAQQQQRDRGAGMGLMGQSAQNMGMASGMFGARSGLGQQQFGNRMGFDEARFGRNQQRFQNSQDMFGFGQSIRNNQFERMGQAQQGMLRGNQDLRQTADLSRSAAVPTRAGESMMDRAFGGLGDLTGGFGGGLGSFFNGASLGGLAGGGDPVTGLLGGGLGGGFF